MIGPVTVSASKAATVGGRGIQTSLVTIPTNPYRTGLVLELMPQNSYAGNVWVDSSGNGNDATAVAGHVPTRDGTLVNGLAAMAFNDSRLTVPLALTQPCTVFCVFKLTNAGNDRWMFDGNLISHISLKTTITDGLFAVQSGFPPAQPATGNLSGIWCAGCGVFNGASSLASANGVTASANIGPNNATSLVIGSDGAIAGFGWLGYMAEILAYTSALSTGNRQLVEQYLDSKYALGF